MLNLGSLGGPSNGTKSLRECIGCTFHVFGLFCLDFFEMLLEMFNNDGVVTVTVTFENA